MDDGSITVAERLNGPSNLMDVDLIPPHQENGTASDSCSAGASTSNACASLVDLKNGDVDGSFKTPSIPLKKTGAPQKKHLATSDVEKADIGALNSKIDALGLTKNVETEDLKIEEDQSDSNSSLKASMTCPNTKKCYSERYPKLVTKSVSNPEEDLIEEMIVDGFSLILFNSIEDFKAFKVHDDIVVKRERAEEEEQRRQAALIAAAEEALRLSKLKKKGRKSKAELEKAQRQLRRQEKRQRREKLRLKKERHRLMRERGEVHPKQETQEQKERREQLLKERHARHEIRRQEKEKRKQLKVKKAQQKALNVQQGVSTTSRQNSALCLPAIGISDIAQRQRLEQQIYNMSMRKPVIPINNRIGLRIPENGFDELVAAAALLFTDPIFLSAQNARQPAGESAAQTPSTPTVAMASTSTHPNENEGRVEHSRPDSRMSDSKRPVSNASAKRPLSVLDPQQQLNGGPNSKMIKMEESDLKRELLAAQTAAGSRRNSFQNQQQVPQRLNYSPFVGMQNPMLNGILPSTADPDFRFAVPQIPIGIQRVTNVQPHPILDPSQLSSLPIGALPIASLLPPGLISSSMNPMMQINPTAAALSASISQANPPGVQATSISEQRPTSSVIKKPFGNTETFNNNPQLNPFANNPDFAAALQQALNAMNGVDPALLQINQSLLGLGAQNFPNQALPLMMNGSINQLNEAQKQLEQLRQPQRAPMSQQQFSQRTGSFSTQKQQPKPFMQQQPQQIRTSQLPAAGIQQPKMQTDVKKQSKSSTLRPQNEAPSSSVNVIAGSLPVSVIRQNVLNQQVPPTVPLSRPITPTFASSIGIQFPPGTALASQLAGAAKLSANATFSARSPTDRWNRIHIDVAETLQKLFAEAPEMDDGSREGQTCAQFPKEWRVTANSQALHLQTPPKDTQASNGETAKTSSEQQAETSTSETTQNEQGGDIVQGTSSPERLDRSEETTHSNRVIGQQASQQPSTTLPQTNQQIQDLAQARLLTVPSVSSIPTLMSSMKAPTVIGQQQAQEQRFLQQQTAQQIGISPDALFRKQLLTAQDAQKAALQQQILASQTSPVAQNQSRTPNTSGFPFSQKGPGSSKTPAPSSQAIQLTGAAALHPSLSSVGLSQGTLTSAVNNAAFESAKLMNLLCHQNAQKQKEAEQLRSMQSIVAGREMAKKSNASSIQTKQEEQKSMHQMPSRQTFGIPSNDLASSYSQNLPPSAQFLLQQLIAAQGGSAQSLAQIQAALSAHPGGGVPPNLLETLALQNRMVQQAIPQTSQQLNVQPQMLPQQAQQSNLMQRQQMPINFPGLPAQISQPMTQKQQNVPPVAALNNVRPGQLDPNQLFALSLLQQQSNLVDQANRNAAQQLPQQSMPVSLDAPNAEMLRQLQQSMLLDRSMNPLLQGQPPLSQQAQQQNLLQQLQAAQAAQNAQLQQLHGLAPGINQNQLANLVGGGMQNLLEADLLMRQMTGQQPPPNLQRSAHDRQQRAEQHRQFREQLMAAANQAGASSASGPLPPSFYHLAALQQQNGQASAAAQMANLQQQQQAIASQLKNPALMGGTPQKN